MVTSLACTRVRRFCGATLRHELSAPLTAPNLLGYPDASPVPILSTGFQLLTNFDELVAGKSLAETKITKIVSSEE